MISDSCWHPFGIIFHYFPTLFVDNMLKMASWNQNTSNCHLHCFGKPFRIKNHILEQTWFLTALGGSFARRYFIVVTFWIVLSVNFEFVCWFAVPPLPKPYPFDLDLLICLGCRGRAPRIQFMTCWSLVDPQKFRKRHPKWTEIVSKIDPKMKQTLTWQKNRKS